MKVDYSKIRLDDTQKQVIRKTILENKYIPIEPYSRQLFAIADKSKRKLIGGSAFSGKSILGAVLALQHYNVPNYRCLILRSTYDNVTATGGIVDYIDEWIKPFDNVEHNQSKRCFINKENNAKIYYSYMLLEKDKEKFKSRAYHKIIVDEASEFFKVNLQFLNRSLRPTQGLPKFPLALYYISNPAAAEGSSYLNEKFVKGPYPFYEMNFWHNPYIDRADYLETLKELSKADYQFQMGNWDYTIQEGDIFDYDMIEDHTISKSEYQEMLTEMDILQDVITWDIAATESKTADYTAWSLSTIFTGKVAAVHNQNSTKKRPGKLEDKMRSIMDQYPDYYNWIEKQPAAAGKIVKRYWGNEFKDYNTSFIEVPKSKILRASRAVRGINRGKILFVRGKWLKDFTKQALKFPPDKIVQDDESTHDDRVDTISLLHEGMYPQKNRIKLRRRKK